MSRPPAARSSVASGLAPPPPPVYPASAHGSTVFAPPPLSAAPTNLSRPQSRLEPPPLAATMGPMPGTLERPIHGPKKRLIVTCDGTWLDADNGLVNGHKQPPSNVSRIGWAIKDTSRDGIPQIVNYQAGVGTMGGPASRVVGGATGLGLKENMRMSYTYLAVNWRAGDEIFLMGFSRGAFTARSVGGMVGALGLLTRSGLPYFNEIFEDWEHRADDHYVSQFPDIPFPEKGRFDDRYVQELARRGLTTLNVPIKAICCWDTVGALGIPRVPWLESLRLQARGMHAYEFYDTTLHPCIENAFQALALDERRAPFTPALWEKRDNHTTNLVQCWFPGVHSNVGGGYDDQELADITLAWMISKLEPFLDFRPNALMGLWEENRAYYKQTRQRTRWWSFGEILETVKGLYALTGARTRTPGNYFRTDPDTGRPTSKRLRGTNEFIHASVRARLGLQGPGVQDRGNYDPPALRDWTFDVEFVGPGHGGNQDGLMVMWNNHGRSSRRRGEKGGQERIPEEKLSETELVLLKQSPRVYDYVMQLRPAGGPGGKRRSRRQHGQNGAPSGPYPGGVGTSQPPPGSFVGGPPPRPPSMAGEMNGRRSRRSLNMDANADASPPDDSDDESQEQRDRERERRHRRRRESGGDPTDRDRHSRRRRSRRYEDDE
ncbi:uncharacterized protein Z519_02776 [Cladophialophora bantiana CBS 173.52]|uniref:T6SS Phospholipase effector Tle1-like catalytic domain-containing protein n=1 Tax=Cladophialophora bantiana (strain ATCC 10958 / CBS 173.52 / CDC B-1940 / NIH 8579) TaxID=1442370 RepID=A0A0D2IKQ2_CLAB1|nr:uncharacterized protein Z519_02776 [Cladophialophora bantiana CBS 173.52]KIW97384.1 hypothetical protein Z519_02776 [Cladophialophora bantiana CBS 173.52]